MYWLTGLLSGTNAASEGANDRPDQGHECKLSLGALQQGLRGMREGGRGEEVGRRRKAESQERRAKGGRRENIRTKRKHGARKMIERKSGATLSLFVDSMVSAKPEIEESLQGHRCDEDKEQGTSTLNSSLFKAWRSWLGNQYRRDQDMTRKMWERA